MLMNNYFTGLSASQKKAMAEGVGTSVPYLSQISTGHRLPSIKLAKRIEKYTRGIEKSSTRWVTKEELRVDVYDDDDDEEVNVSRSVNNDSSVS